MNLTDIAAVWGAFLSTILAFGAWWMARPQIQLDWIHYGSTKPSFHLWIYNTSARPMTITRLEIWRVHNGQERRLFPIDEMQIRKRIEPHGGAELEFSEQYYVSPAVGEVSLHLWLVGRKRVLKKRISV